MSLDDFTSTLQELLAWWRGKVDDERRGIVGAVWTFGKVTSVYPLQVQLDGDSTDTPAMALGMVPAVNTRVRVVVVARRPIILSAKGGVGHAHTPADVTIASSAYQDVGCSVTITVASPSSRFLVIGSFDVASNNSTAVATFIGVVNVDGTNQPEQAIVTNSGGSVSFRANCSQSWLVSGLPAGDRVFKLRAAVTTDNALKVRSHTSLSVVEC